MFGLDRFRRQLTQLVGRIPTGENFSPKNVLEKYLGTSAGDFGLIARVNDLLGQEPSLSQFLSQELRHIMNQDATPATIYNILALGKFAETLSAEIATEDRVDGYRFEALSEQLQSLKKERNKQIVTLKGVLDELTTYAREDYTVVQNINNWSDILERIFGTRADLHSNRKKNEIIDPRELTGEYLLRGELVEAVGKKFGALISYAVSLLTVTGGTPQFRVFNNDINKILRFFEEDPGFTVLLQRLQQYCRRHVELRDQVVRVRDQISAYAAQNCLELSKGISLINEVLADHPFDEIITNVNPVTEDPRFAGMFRYFNSKNVETECERDANLYLITEREISHVLGQIDNLLNNLIQTVNDVNSSLCRRGLKVILPISDIEKLEAVGIRLSNIAEGAALQE